MLSLFSLAYFMFIVAIFRAVVEKKKEEPKVEVVDDDFDDLDLDMHRLRSFDDLT